MGFGEYDIRPSSCLISVLQKLTEQNYHLFTKISMYMYSMGVLRIYHSEHLTGYVFCLTCANKELGSSTAG